MAETREQKRVRLELFKEGKKRCSEKAGCGQIKSLDDFGLDKGTWDNRAARCRICDRAKSKRYRKENPEARKAYARQYRIDNLEERRTYRRTYYAKKQQEDPLFTRLDLGARRAKKAGAEWENISSTELLSHWKLRDITLDTCYYCKQSIDEGELEIDHGIPICSGGSHTLDNLYPCHRSCNRQKNNKNVNEYLEHLKQAV